MDEITIRPISNGYIIGYYNEIYNEKYFKTDAELLLFLADYLNKDAF